MLRQKQFGFGTLVAGLLVFAVATTAMALEKTINYKGGQKSFQKALISNGREYKCKVTGAPGGTKYDWDPPGFGIVSGGGGDSNSSLTWKSNMTGGTAIIKVDIYPSGEGGGGGGDPYHANWDAVVKEPTLSVFLWDAGGPLPGDEAYICGLEGGSQQAAADIVLGGDGKIDIVGKLYWTVPGSIGSVSPTEPVSFTTSHTGDSPKLATYTVQPETQNMGLMRVRGTIKNELGEWVTNKFSGPIHVFYDPIDDWDDYQACGYREQNPEWDIEEHTDGCSCSPENPAGGYLTSFTGPCNNHDECYQTCDSVKSTCDSTFSTQMMGVCNYAYEQEDGGPIGDPEAIYVNCTYYATHYL